MAGGHPARFGVSSPGGGSCPRHGTAAPAHIPAPAPASSPPASKVPFSWARTDAGHFSPGLGMSLWFRDIYLLFIIMEKK